MRNVLVIVGEPATAYSHGAESGGINQYTGPAYSAKMCFMAAGSITTIVNKGFYS